ncbi:tryptophan 7-halogenase [Caulobacter sp. 602-2]|uniref:Tryptophan 7-halogenase n=1 Tax=Caulobacter sp. 602-2 TaxID=2710887 RepID=A0A6G4QX75_9CAUL|nr:tryptophan halogenase family protein [Caulobacter sp. 602-2]NGM49845.1 tryptophan 7-halogenase [Caulobacter sp. 602-2]
MSEDVRNGRIRSIVIVGGGTAGWMAAASLRRHFGKAPIDITLVESSEIGTIGVGEATIPTIRNFYQSLGLDDLEVLRATQGTCKLGIRFKDWMAPGSAFIHPFSLYGQDLNGVPFQHYWLKARSVADVGEMGEYSLGASLAAAGNFTVPAANPPSSLSVFDWALHFDAALFAQLMRRVAEANGVRRIDAKVVKVNLRPEDGFVASLDLHTGQVVEGDLFIDCSGFRGLLIEEALGTGYEDWSQWLFCDRALAVQSQPPEGAQPPPYTDVTAHTAGWRWRIPLQHRYGNGYVYSSRHIDDEAAKAELVAAVPDRLLHEPRLIRFTPGRRKKVWNRNVVALGLASGFLEPLESTSIALIETGIEKLKALFPDRGFDPAVVDEFNDWSRREMERVRDFVVLHYKAAQRGDTPFWRTTRDADIPETLARKVELFRSRGHIARYRWEMFQPPSWLAIFAGFDILPDGWDPALDGIDGAALAASLNQMRAGVARAVAQAPTHGDFLRRYVGAAPAAAE